MICGIPIFSQAAVGYDSPYEGEEVAEHRRGVENSSGAIFTKLELVTKKENQDSYREGWGKERERDRARENSYLYIAKHDTEFNYTTHAIVGEPLTELTPHNEEYREWKGSQLAELLYQLNILTGWYLPTINDDGTY